MPADSDLNLRLRHYLNGLPPQALPITYQQAAEALGLSPPRTIRRVAVALETLMQEDVAAGRPMLATLVVSRRGDLPGAGFFELAVALGRFPANPAEHRAAYQREFAAAIAQRG
ncbi:hypothetical protein LG277_12895 [Vreelandella aquamarina]|uniref:hypothetical protein n=1 Tax=Vreelandella aquamarina TaxID=77097 RepID=UPI00384A6DE6